MSRRDNKLIRADKDFDKKLKEAANARIINGVDKVFRTNTELTKMILNCPSFPLVEKELTHEPKREDLLK